MPRRQFKADVADLCRRASTGSLPNLWAVNCDGLDDNDEFVVVIRSQRRGHRIHVRILCGDVDTYPNTNSYFLSIDTPHATAADTALIASFQSASHRRASSRKYPVLRLVRDMSEKLTILGNPPSPSRRSMRISPVPAIPMDIGEDGDTKDTTDSNTNDSTCDSTDSDTDSDADDDWSDDASAFDFNGPLSDDAWTYSQGRHTSGSGGTRQQQTTDNQAHLDHPSPLSQRISRDLHAVVRQGYRFGVIKGMTDTAQDHILSVAVRVSELGLPRQTLLAWDLDPAVYVVLLIHMQSGYTPYEALVTYPREMTNVSFRIGKCQRYKPSISAAMSAFGLLPTKVAVPRTAASPEALDTFSKIMISNSLNTFMSSSFLSLSKYRDGHGCSWSDAMDAMRKQTHGNTAGPDRVGKDGPENRSPAVVTDKPTTVERSFPLLAMQFAMDQVVNCTRYCQACHARMDEATASIKPTVCSDALCLFQYIQMGMGRSTEHEILAQPTVVDLLVSFCYAALNYSLRAYPESIGLRVMDPDRPCPIQGIYRCQRGRRPYILLRDRCFLSQFRVGDWVAIRPSDVVEMQTPSPPLPHIYAHESHLRHAIVTQVDADNATLYMSHGTFPYGDIELQHACVCRHDTPFEDVPAQGKSKILRLVLNTLPPIAWIRTHLENHACTSLRAVPGVSPSAARLLEWILATNRSCILEIQCRELDFAGPSSSQQPLLKWAQFSFLHGSPDADARFQKAQQTAGVNPSHPTLLAWHGSAIKNWHDIVRTGLDYQVVTNGRSYGDGVYFSPQFNYSRGYARASDGVQWANSQFDLQKAMSLNEVVNAPSQFVSYFPHYVVSQPDWHQCRVLLVGQRKPRITTPLIIGNDDTSAVDIAGTLAAAAIPARPPLVATGWFDQDTKYPACGPQRALKIPLDLFPAASDRQPAACPNSDKKDFDAEDAAARADMNGEDLAFLGDSATGPRAAVQTRSTASITTAQSGTPESQKMAARSVSSVAATTPSPASSSLATPSGRSRTKAQRQAKRAQRKRAQKKRGAE